MDVKLATQQLLGYAREGRFGTPQRPSRGSAERWVFWACYFGYRKVSDYRGTISEPSARAGAQYRKEMEKKS